ncbi:sulfolipid-1 biosynthesis phthioceranic/hydroxyphthioceranic acid synthase [Mycobacterium sp. 94-17]|uniref:sulfolipid-1 biosynthesis phthioceranic/hydroxyphthioceranic acid synthase n=1 Tax=Mycobacterium sp. 94-17 TaxID=2986147 RepID=UPI002D1F7525|nr:sulfolipid-1 biosynthesis phthioceranic/hydroxyphthioceranic acid synthase [Mycobacterium sp. 94-17]MEB4209233.1 sulfolipid-1 biosynthesis phthioceranic/hydroxyphthioceranic acid synthase [Mycobacterium sp. 94-17]
MSTARVDAASPGPVAVIGMACRLPGGIVSPEQLWEALLRGDDLVTEIPPDRWDADEYYDPQAGVPGRSVCKWGAFLDDIAGFDAEFFGITETEATAMDPQHRLLLETSWEAIEHGGLTPQALAGSQTGVFMGLMHGDYQLMHAEADALEGPYGYLGNSFAMGSGRIAYALGLRGPAMTVDTACSSGLAAVHMALRSLRDGESDIALAGGASVSLEPRKSCSGSAIGMLSPTGRCHAFDVAADGFVVGEGCVVFLLKRLPDAIAAGDRILAVVRGSAANQDGHTVNIVTPSRAAQVEAYRAALAAAGVDASTVGMVEAHGPGTPVGDPIEYAGLAEVYGLDGPCALASVKTNFGHTQSAAGALGLMKAILAVRHGVIPRNLHFARLPDEMAEIDTKLFVPQATMQWPDDADRGPRRAAVSSYGFSGTNVHAIVEQAPEATAPGDAITPGHAGTRLFALSATSADGLRHTAGRLADWLDAREQRVAASDLAYTLARRRAHRPVRTAVIADGLTDLTARLRAVAADEFPFLPAAGQDDRGPVWLFSGQGSQWAAMGAELLATEPVVAATIGKLEPLIAAESGFSVTQAISMPDTVTGIDRIQPSLFAMQVALADAMRAYGVQPGAVIGHSMGEAAAAVVAGALSLEDGVRVICRRSRLMSTIAGSGAMASVDLPAEQVLLELMARGVDDVALAVVASPHSTVIGGAAQPVRDLVTAWEQRDVLAREIAVDVASHSPQVDPILDELCDALAGLAPMTPRVPFYTATAFDPREQPVCDAWYWSDNLRHMVRFAAAVEAALEDGHRVFAELAPHPLLTHAVEQTAGSAGMPVAALAAMRREQALPHGLRGFLADLFSAGAAMDFSAIHPAGRLVDAPLPTWTHRPLLLTRKAPDPRARIGSVPAHPLLGAHVRLHEEPERHVWQGEAGTAAHPWLGDHRVHLVAALPGAAYCEMAMAAARTIFGESSEARDVRFETMLLLDDETPVSAVASVTATGAVDFAVQTVQDGAQTRRATAALHPVADEDRPPAYDMPALFAAYPCRLEGTELRTQFDGHGLQYGPAFAGLAAVHHADEAVDTVLAEVGLPGPLRSQHHAYGVHPALLDACFQSVAAHFSIRGARYAGLLLPLGLRRIRAYGPARTARYCHTTLTRADGAALEADLDVLDEDGTVLLAVRGLQLGTGTSESANRERVLNERLLAIEWKQRDLPEVDHAGPRKCLLISTSATADLMATGLADALKIEGAGCATMTWPQHVDHQANTDSLGSHLADGVGGIVILTGSDNGDPEVAGGPPGADQVRHLARITREITKIGGDPPRLYVVTRNAQSVLPGDVANLEQAGLRGLVRAINTEYPHLRATQLDLDEHGEAEQLARQLLGDSEEDETAWRGGQWYVARLGPAPLRPEERRTAVLDPRHDGMRVQIRTPGDAQTMELAACQRVPPGPGEIEVRVGAAGVNFADVLLACAGHPDMDGDRRQLGMDFAGVVTAVGSDVTDHRVGDRVGGFSESGCWATFVTCDARLAVTLPPGLTEARAAAVTTPHAVAWYALHDQARVTGSDRVLIHSATGSVGRAAIAIARAAGAEIFATAGTPERRELLHDLGIGHVYDSHGTDFAERIGRETDGEGVDIVLNPLPGAAQRAGLDVLRAGGRFVEIGQHGVRAGTRLDLAVFQRNLTFHYVDLALMSQCHPNRIGDLLRTVYRLAAEGALPPPQSTHYPLGDAAAAIRAIDAAALTGKAVLDVARSGPARVVVPPGQARPFRQDGSYIVTGGLGGIGLFLAEKMAAGGCGRIVLSSRSEPSPKTLETIELIRAMGTDIAVECGDITDADTATRLVSAATATGRPLRGVLHAAAVFENAMLADMTDELIDRNWAPKVHGAWNLHRATATLALDWFCLFSSAVGLVGSPGQGAYAAANGWLDSFARRRRARGLPATAIGWGLWAEVGRAAELRAGDGLTPGHDGEGTAIAHWRDTAFTADDGAEAFAALLRHDRAYSGYADLAGTPWFAAYAQRSRFAEAFRSNDQTHSDAGTLLNELHALPAQEWPVRLRRMISDAVSLILRRTIDPDHPLSEYGLDSMGNLELRTRIEAETGIRVTTNDITTIQGLAELLREKLRERLDPASSGPQVDQRSEGCS